MFQGENDPEFVPGVDIDRLVAWCRMEFPYLGHYPVYPDCNGKIVSRESISKTPYFGASLRDDSDARYLGGVCHSGIAGFVAVSWPNGRIWQLQCCGSKSSAFTIFGAILVVIGPWCFLHDTNPNQLL